MEIKVYGPGCAKCVGITFGPEIFPFVIKAPGVTVEKVSDIREMMKAGILSTPAVVIDGVLKSSGRVPSKEEIESWIS